MAGRELERPVVWICRILLVTWGAVGLGLGCDDSEQAPPEVYRVNDVAVETAGDDAAWTPEADRVDRWFSRALASSDEGISSTEGDAGMRVRLHHRVRLQETADRTRLAVYVRARVARNFVGDGDPAVALSAEATEASLLGEQHPSQLRLHRENNDLGERAVERVVDKLRLRARLHREGTDRLVAWIADDAIDPDRRTIAIEWAVDRELDGETVGDALARAAAADDPDVAYAACEALVELDIDGAARVVLERAQQLSRDDDYEAYLRLVPILGELDERYVSIYLQTVAEAHEVPKVRQKARSALDDPLPRAKF